MLYLPPIFKITMTKADIINEIAEKTGVERAIVLNTIESFMKVVKGNMVKGENIYLRGFGTFLCKKRAAKVGRIITKNQEIKIPAHYIPAFKPAKTFSEKIKKNVKVNESK
ncbi:MAG: integration host factor subunit beta [Bacteroidetes bacterium]|nr:integration host factor subunit beta [Bacteroidota bacterium]